MSPTSIGGGCRFGFQVVSISPASLKRASVVNFSVAEKFTTDAL